MSLMRHQRDDFALNEFTPANTFEGSPVVEFEVSGAVFAMGFWPTESLDGANVAPFAVLIVKEAGAWRWLGDLPPLWGDDLAMDSGSRDDDLRHYMWFLSERFSSMLSDYLAARGAEGEAVPEENWRAVLRLMSTVVVDGQAIAFPSA